MSGARRDESQANGPEGKAEIIGRYALYDEIASGGMASVYFGTMLGPVGFSRPVAIKRLHPQYALDPHVRSMLLDEARLVARIRHPNVVPTLDVLATQGEFLLVMEYVHGEPLSKLARTMRSRGEEIPLRIILAIMTGVLHGLHAAHEAKTELGEPLGIVHRDISPQNVLVGVDGQARVIDFGVAYAAVRVAATQEGVIKGKLAYMSPEQLSERPLTRAADIYAASVVLWELLAGRRLFVADGDLAAMFEKILRGPIEPPSRYRPGLPKEIDDIVARGMDRDPSKRFESAREMALAIERAGDLALPSEVGEWVENVGAESLALRAEKLAEFERASARGLAAIGPADQAAFESVESLLERLDRASREAPATIPRAKSRPSIHEEEPPSATFRRAEGTTPGDGVGRPHSATGTRATRSSGARVSALPSASLAPASTPSGSFHPAAVKQASNARSRSALRSSGPGEGAEGRNMTILILGGLVGVVLGALLATVAFCLLAR